MADSTVNAFLNGGLEHLESGFFGLQQPEPGANRLPPPTSESGTVGTIKAAIGVRGYNPIMKLGRNQDAYGLAVWDKYHGEPAFEIVERSDGRIAPSGGPEDYLAEYPKWQEHVKTAVKLAAGRVLDIGCNAGRHALYLQEKGHDVVGVDISPLALKTARLRGLRQTRLLSITELTRATGRFDTILMLGNNFGLFGNRTRARWLLRRFKGFTAPGARIIAESLDVHRTDDPEHLAYGAANRRKGRMSGQIRMRIRYKTLATPWFDYLMVSADEMNGIVSGTGWEIGQCFDSDGPRPNYIAVLERTGARSE